MKVRHVRLGDIPQVEFTQKFLPKKPPAGSAKFLLDLMNKL
jgi:hypothetical protein